MAGKKILVVDDMQSVIDLLTIRLASEGFEICSAQSGEEAVEKAQKEKPQAIVMDVMMPGMSGFEAMSKLRDIRETRDIPAIIMSARAGMKDFFTDMREVEFIPKPLDLDRLVSRLKILVGGALQRVDAAKRIVLAGVEDLLVSKIRTSLRALHLEVFTALDEKDALLLIKKMQPVMVLCQFWEDEHVFSAREIAKQVSEDTSIAKIPFYVYCKTAISMGAMKSFNPEKILTYKETSDLLRSVEGLVRK